MSRIGKLPITVPQGAKVHISGDSASGGTVRVEGPLGSSEYTLRRGISAVLENGALLIKADFEGTRGKAMSAYYGTARAHLNNMVRGVTKGWKRSLELVGVGFNAKISGQTLILAVGFSHDVELEIPKGVKCNVTKTTIDLESYDKEVLGTFAARIRKVQPPEPYLGKGVKYSDETIRRKAGKTGKK